VDLARNLIQRINVGDSLTRSAAARPGKLADLAATTGASGANGADVTGVISGADGVPGSHASGTAEPECFVDDRDAISYLYTSGTHTSHYGG